MPEEKKKSVADLEREHARLSKLCAELAKKSPQEEKAVIERYRNDPKNMAGQLRAAIKEKLAVHQALTSARDAETKAKAEAAKAPKEVEPS